MPLPALFLATVISVTDGATLTVLHQRQPVTVRLADIDAPSLERPFGAKSRQHLAKLCRGIKAEIRPQFQDRSGGIVADISCRGKDAGAEQVRMGLALVDERHSTKRALYEAQASARKQRSGLWTDPKTVLTWENPASNQPGRDNKKTVSPDKSLKSDRS